jgi:hypothetical protein
VPLLVSSLVSPVLSFRKIGDIQNCLGWTSCNNCQFKSDNGSISPG